jgi:hypothetical protein
MSFRGSSRRRGRRPAWIRRAADVRFVDVSAGAEEDTILHFTAPPFGEVAEEVYRQGQLFDALPSQSDSAFDVMGDTIHDVATRRKNSDRFDVGVLQRIEGFSEPVFHGVDEIACFGGRLPVAQPPRIDRQLTTAAADLYMETPEPIRIRVSGKLDMLRVSDKVFTLILGDGQRVRGIWLGDSVSAIRHYLDQVVVVNGVASYRPAGSLLRIDVETIDQASSSDRLFSKIPASTATAARHATFFRNQTPSIGMKAVFGKWPGDETDSEVSDTLAEIE